MWNQQWRETVWSQLDQEWDMLVIGGGITGAGIFREAARLGLRVLLVDQHDFGWGTSSRSSKFVHGGLRYLKEGQLGLTRSSVLEREQLLADAPGLVDPIGFLLATYRRDKIGRTVYRAGLAIYDLLALQWSHRYYSPADFQLLAPHIEPEGLKGGFHYQDAQTDDARLVLRVIQEGAADGRHHAIPLNYTAVTGLLRDENGRVCGAQLRDEVTGQGQPVRARVVVNATGSWADRLRRQVGGAEKIRPLRGSHLIFPGWRLPVAQVVTFLHPIDQRPVMVFPWEGVTMVGTTDVDHPHDDLTEPCISPEEVAYLMAAVTAEFPSLNIDLRDVIATQAGVRPVIGTGKEDPSDESREHVLWLESGLLTVTGGKLTTFRLIAHDALKTLRERFPDWPPLDDKIPALTPAPPDLLADTALDSHLRRRLCGRYGPVAAELVAAGGDGELECIPGTRFTWAELRWAARAEGVQHLEDLLLRRLRLGLLLPEGGRAHLPRIRAICQAELGWGDGRWQDEEAAYLALWRHSYSLPPLETIPDWRAMLAQVEVDTAVSVHQPSTRHWVVAGLLGAAVVLTAVWLWRRNR
ncbi:MAG TPA: glycerol-3-phosphate dehydrogenase/oxidase [Chloroflexota bacterium]|nr:glycerol-3-phosphate dehydrogenase/oxidase [Chloroflexota bacterium]